MTNTITGNLDPYFTSLISDLMTIERQPLTQLQKSRDQVVLQKNIYTDLNSSLQGLQDAVKALRANTDTNVSSIKTARSVTVAPTTSGASVVTASAADTAATGTYQIAVSSLAREHRVWTTRQTSSDQALSLTGTFSINGVSIDVTSSDSLTSLAATINSKTFASGQEVTASVVDQRLVIAANQSGAAASLTLSDTTGGVLQSLGVLDSNQAIVAANQQAATDAAFTLNGVPITRSTNTGLTDVIAGVTLNLSADAKDKAATLTVGVDTSGAQAALNTFIQKFNASQAYLQAKTAITSNTVNGVTTYTRGPLANDNVFKNLRGDLFDKIMSDSPNAGAYQNLRAIGISLDDNLQLTVSDSSKLSAALSGHLTDVQTLLESTMGGFDTLLGRFTGSTSGYLSSSLQSFSSQLTDFDANIASFNVRLADKQQSLYDQFGQTQAMLQDLTYQQQEWSTVYGKISALG